MTQSIDTVLYIYSKSGEITALTHDEAKGADMSDYSHIATICTVTFVKHLLSQKTPNEILLAVWGITQPFKEHEK